MCNLYSVTTNQEAIRRLFRVDVDNTGNLPPMPGVYPDYAAPIVRNSAQGRELAMARWGLPTPSWVLLKGKPKGTDPRSVRDSGTTNIRNTELSYWRRWFGVEHRCLVPFNSFAEPDNGTFGGKAPVWFAFDESRPLACFAGIWTPKWTSIRKVKEGETTADLFAFLTINPNAEVAAIHLKAMPVILRTPEEWDSWMTAPAAEALQLQRPLPDGALRIVAQGAKEDPGADAGLLVGRLL
ncbi:MAG TPA: SOS response-associated peptidase [Reyranella sp.]